MKGIDVEISHGLGDRGRRGAAVREGATVRILVVDDHPQCRATTVRLLDYLGYQAMGAADVAEATLQLTRHGGGIPVVMVDLYLDGALGVELAQRLEREHPGVSVLFMSGDGEEMWRSSEFLGPKRHFIAKPFSIVRLAAAIEVALAAAEPAMGAPADGQGPR